MKSQEDVRKPQVSKEISPMNQKKEAIEGQVSAGSKIEPQGMPQIDP